MTPKRERGTFATTRWTTVNAAGQTSESQAANALAELCETYWSPLYGYLRRRGYRPEEAQDLTQGFLRVCSRPIRSGQPIARAAGSGRSC